MKSRYHSFRLDVLASIPSVFCIIPSSNYASDISHSTKQLDKKAWEMTGKQLKQALPLSAAHNKSVENGR